MTYHIETERLLLRELRESDLDNMFEMDSNRLVHEYLGKKPLKTKAESLKNIKDIKRQYDEHGIGRWAAIEKESGSFIGWSGLRLYSKEDGSFNNISNFYDVGFRFLPEYWGKGYATESGKAAIAYGFKSLNLNAIYGITELGNEASHKALLKIGLDFIEEFYHEKLKMRLRWYKITHSV